MYTMKQLTNWKLQSPNKPKIGVVHMGHCNWDAVKDEAHFLYYSFLNLDFSTQYLQTCYLHSPHHFQEGRDICFVTISNF